ncbi:hypothetical protein LPB86_12020 [Pedobacter sp. MC2016-14]|uniref:hypothetical protein n=1 Tax=Pedobacter sp. MC2016-14 TaxID=2897327 RepID=UPI001E4D2F83|nr:hypothetical protein [Pedobacter sp. MC2016-14]MCD0488957.1 hypothetical protein [Pedobacter sp. MC2016-14]
MKKHKLLRKASIMFLLSIQIIFLFSIFRENLQSMGILISIAIISILILAAYTSGKIHHHEHQYEHILVVIWIPIGAVTSFYLNHYLEMGPVISASAVGLVASFTPNFKKLSTYLQKLPSAIYCGAFIGMSSTSVAPNLVFVLTASFFTAVLILVSKSLFSGVGGKLGTLAFAGVVTTSFIYYLISRYA